MTYPEEFFRPVSVADTLSVLDKGLERAAQLKEGKSPWTSQKGRATGSYAQSSRVRPPVMQSLYRDVHTIRARVSNG